MSDDHDATAPSATDSNRVEEHSIERQHERAEHVENILEETESHLRGRKYPVTTEELATEYADQPLDMANETESLGSVFDRMTDRQEFESADEVREALYNELTGEAEGESLGEYNDERNLGKIADAENDVDDVDKP